MYVYIYTKYTQKTAKALTNARLVTEFPTLRKLKNLETEKPDNNQPIKRDKARSRQTYFCIGTSKVWTEKIHKILKVVRNKFGLGWLRISMSYHKFSNL